MKPTTVLLIAVLAAAFATRSQALMVEQPVDRIAASSHAVIRGRVLGQQSHWDSDHGSIVTDVTLGVTEAWAGAVPPGQTIVTRIRGGEVSGTGMVAEDQPRFAADEDVVLFLLGNPDGTFSVNYEAQGKFRVEGDRVVGNNGRSFPCSELRLAVESSSGPGGSELGAPFPPCEPGPPVDDDNFYAYCGVKWFNLPYTWLLNQNGSPGCSLVDTQGACDMAFNTWMCNSGVSMIYGGTTSSNAANHSDRLNVLAWEVGTLGSGTIALCSYVYYVDTGEIIEIDIEFNAQYFTWSCSGSLTDMDVENIATHEVGHTLCLGDLYGGNDTNKTMYGFSWNGDFAKRSLLTADALGAESIYPHVRPNLAAGTPGGWSSPLVPRATGDANESWAPLPPELFGNWTSYVNAAMTNSGGDCAAPQGSNNLWLDGVEAWFNWWYGVWWGGLTWGPWINMDLWVRGGRHTLTCTLDDDHETLESNETDNSYDAQYVWSPLVTVLGTPNVRDVPPDRGFFPLPNSDGMKFTRNSSYAWVTSLAPRVPGDDYDLYVYDDYSGSTTGFSNPRGFSTYGSNATDFVVGHYQNTPTSLFPATVRYAVPSGYEYAADQIDASGRNAYDTGLWMNQLLSDYRLADVYEGYFTTGTTYHLTLARISGTADVAFNVYPCSSGGIYGRGGAAGFSTPIDAARDALDFTAVATGWYPIVVYRSDGSDPSRVVYNLYWNLPASVDDAIRPPDFVFQGATPNPMGESSTLVFRLPAGEHVRIDLYDVGGRRVRGLLDAFSGPGVQQPIWDGRDDDGQRVPAGLYVARLQTRSSSQTRIVTVVR